MIVRTSIVAVSLAICAVAHSQVLYSQLPVPGGEGGPFSESDGQQLADTMVPIANGVAELARFWGSAISMGDPYNVGNQFQFTLTTWDRDGSGNPNNILNQATLIATITAETGPNGIGDMVYQYDTAYGGLGPALTSGGQYMYSVWESDPNTPVNQWRWHNGIGPGDYASHRFGGGGWAQETGDRGDLGFELRAVPEPASLLALSTGFVVILKRRRRKAWTGKSPASLL